MVSLFHALGCQCEMIDTPPCGVYVVVDLDGSRPGDNDMFVSLVEPEQLVLEQALRERFRSSADNLAVAYRRMREMMARQPHRAAHVGLRYQTISALDETVVRLNGLAHGSLRGRLALGDPWSRTREQSEATSTPMKQLWIWTDVISTGLLAFGQQIELQAYKE